MSEGHDQEHLALIGSLTIFACLIGIVLILLLVEYFLDSRDSKTIHVFPFFCAVRIFQLKLIFHFCPQLMNLTSVILLLSNHQVHFCPKTRSALLRSALLRNDLQIQQFAFAFTFALQKVQMQMQIVAFALAFAFF